MSKVEKGAKTLGGCFGMFVIGIVAIIAAIVIAVGTGLYYSWHNLLSDEPLDIEPRELSWQSKQALKVRLLPVQQAIEKNKASKFRLTLTDREANYVLQELLDRQKIGSKAQVLFNDDEVDLKFTRPLKKLLYLNIEVEASARVKDGAPEIFLKEACIGYYCPEGYVLSLGSNLVEWEFDDMFCSKDSQIFIKDMDIKDGKISLKFETQEVHPSEVEEGSTVEETQSL